MLDKLRSSDVNPIVGVIVIVILLLVIGFVGWRMFGRSGSSAVHVTVQKPGEPFAGAKRVYGTP